MQPGVPASTSLIFKTRLRPPSDPEKPAELDFLVDVHDLSFTEVADHRMQPDVMFVASLWTRTDILREARRLGSASP